MNLPNCPCFWSSYPNQFNQYHFPQTSRIHLYITWKCFNFEWKLDLKYIKVLTTAYIKVLTIEKYNTFSPLFFPTQGRPWDFLKYGLSEAILKLVAYISINYRRGVAFLQALRGVADGGRLSRLPLGPALFLLVVSDLSLSEWNEKYGDIFL